MSDRAVSPVIGLVILMGIVAISAVAILVVGGALTDSTAEEATTQQTERSLAEFAETANQLSAAEQTSDTFAVEAGDSGNAYVNESAGHIEMNLVLNESTGNIEQVLDQDMGAFVTETGSDTEFAYQGGGVWRVDGDGQARLVRAPDLQYNLGDSPTRNASPTLNVPVVQVRGNDSGTAQGAGDLQVEQRRDAFPFADVSNPVIGDYMNLTIQSRYCHGWESYAESETAAAINETCDQGTPQQLKLRMDLADGDTITRSTTKTTTTPGVNNASVSGGGPGVNSHTVNAGTSPGGPNNNGNSNSHSPDVDVPDEEDPEGVYGFYAEGPITVGSAGGNFIGSIASGDNVTNPYNNIQVSGSVDEGVPSDRDPYPDVEAIVQNAPNGAWSQNLADSPHAKLTNYYGYEVNGTTGGRWIYLNSTDVLSNTGEPVEFDVSDGDINVVVDGDFSTALNTQISVLNAESSNNSVNVYTNGDVDLSGSTRIFTETNPFSGGTQVGDLDDDDVYADGFTIYGSDSSDLDGDSTIQIEGSIILPNGAGIGSASLQMAGSLYLGEFTGSSFSLNIFADGTAGRDIETDPGPGDLEGVVYNASTTPSDGIGNVDIELTGTDVSNSNTTVTASDGEFEIEDVPAGNYTLEAMPPATSDYNSSTINPVRIVGNGTTEIEIPLDYDPPAPTHGDLEVNVEDENGNVKDADVSVSGPDNPSDQTTSSGSTTFTGISKGDYTVELDPLDSAYNSGWHTVAPAATVAGGDTTYVNVTLDDATPDNGTLKVSVFDNSSNAAIRSDVTVESLADGTTWTGDTSTNSPAGNVSFDLNSTEKYDVSVTPDGAYDPTSLSGNGMKVNVSPNKESTVEFPLETGTTTSRTTEVVTSSGSPGEVHYLHVSETVLRVEDD